MTKYKFEMTAEELAMVKWALLAECVRLDAKGNEKKADEHFKLYERVKFFAESRA